MEQSTSQIRDWICKYIADILQVPVHDIATDVSFDRLGLDSASAVALVGDLEEWLGFDIDPTLPHDFPTVESLASELRKMGQASSA
jgi:acyl carrier protein